MGASSLLTELLWEALGAAKEGVRQTEPAIWLTTTWDSTQQLMRVCVPPGLVGSGKGEDFEQ